MQVKEPPVGIEPATYALRDGWESLTLVTYWRQEFDGRPPPQALSTPGCRHFAPRAAPRLPPAGEIVTDRADRRRRHWGRRYADGATRNCPACSSRPTRICRWNSL